MFVEVSFGLKNYDKTSEESPATDAAPAAEHTAYAAHAAGSASNPGDDAYYNGDKLNRAGLDRCRVMVLHIDHNSARDKIGNAKLRLRQFAMDIIRYQVDFIGGDSNGCAYKAKNRQYCVNPGKSAFVLMLKAIARFINGTHGWPKLIGAKIVTNKPMRSSGT